MLDVIIYPRAMLDMDSIQVHLKTCTGAEKPAQNFADETYTAIEKLSEFPGMGSKSPYASDNSSKDYQCFLVGTLYWIYYTYDEDALTVWRIIHAKQEIDDYMLLDL